MLNEGILATDKILIEGRRGVQKPTRAPQILSLCIPSNRHDIRSRGANFEMVAIS